MAEAGISQAALVRPTFSYVITITKRNIYLKGCTVLTKDLKIQPEGMQMLKEKPLLTEKALMTKKV